MSTADQGRFRGRVPGRGFGKIVVTLASALTAAAVAAPGALAAEPVDGGSTPCVQQTFGKGNTYRTCVGAMQVLLNDLRNAYLAHHIDVNYGPDRILKTDGLYGDNTWSDVYAVNKARTGGHLLSGTTTPDTWKYVCGGMRANGLYHGSTYYDIADCDVLFGGVSSPPAGQQVGSAPSQQVGSAPSQQVGPTPGPQMGSAPGERMGSLPGERIGPACPPKPATVPQPPGSGPAPGAGPRPGRWIEHASWIYQRYQDKPARCGWTLQVTPTSLERAGNFVTAGLGWNELYRDYKNVAHGIKRNVQGLKRQYICHAVFVAVKDPKKQTWNLDEWRPDVSRAATVRANCNP